MLVSVFALGWRSDRVLRAVKVTCPECKGVGVVLVEETVLLAQNYSRFAEPDYRQVEMLCEACNGLGQVADE